ncbi:hypothetical protein ACQCVO_02425 [Bacillus infantis]|uniref:hypothetical protein n=1 Tax=Bacillus infantis TaxID=324767 RepID=UPI003CE9F23C
MKKTIVTIIVVIIGASGFVTFKAGQEGFNIRVENETNKAVSGLYLTYDNIKSDIEIPSIASGEKYTLNVNPNENSNDDFSEAALKLEYKDNKGISHTEYIIGYFEKGYSGEAVINIESMDEDGNLEVEIKDNTTLY